MKNIKGRGSGLPFVILLLIIGGVIFYVMEVNPPSIILSPPSNDYVPINLSIYPDPTLTPGDVMSTNWSEVCADGYSASVRDVSESKKKEVYARYGVIYPQPTGSYECDHFVPLSIGGSNELTNLWPEAEEPRPGFREKDVVEAALHRAVCHEKVITLEQAQEAIISDWYKVYTDYGYVIKDITPTEDDN
jgi:hypothetical protein